MNILSFLKEEFEATDEVGVIMNTKNVRAIIAALEENAARIKRLEGIIERIERFNNDFLYNPDLTFILNEA